MVPGLAEAETNEADQDGNSQDHFDYFCISFSQHGYAS